MDTSSDGAESRENEQTSSPNRSSSPEIDRNPSPPPDKPHGAEDADLDAIGDTAYSKHWLFSTLTRLISMVSQHSAQPPDAPMQLSDDDEEDLCKVWDMAMDQDVATFLQEFKATDILLGVIAKSQCPRLTEICVGVLGNIACFPETCATLSQNEDLGAVLLLLLGDTDPPTLLETCRFLLTCVSQKDLCSLWIQRVRKQKAVRANVCFIMCSSTNADLLEKVGELVDKLFDQDEELMKSWISAEPSEEEEEEEEEGGKSHLDLTLCLLEASKQLRSENLKAVEVYLHIFHLLSTVHEGAELLTAADGPGPSVWDFVLDVVCEDLIQPGDLPVVLHEQKGILVQAFVVLHTLYRREEQKSSSTILPLFGTILRVCQYQRECDESSADKGDTKDKQLQTLSEMTAEFLSDLCSHISKETAADLIKHGYLTEHTLLIAAATLLPKYQTALQHLQAVLSQTDPRLADVVEGQLPV